MSKKPNYEVKYQGGFWNGLNLLSTKYTHEQLAEVIKSIKLCIKELEDKGYVDEEGWNDHFLVKKPFNDGHHREFHTYDDDVLVVYFRKMAPNVIRMVCITDHDGLREMTAD